MWLLWSSTCSEAGDCGESIIVDLFEPTNVATETPQPPATSSRDPHVPPPSRGSATASTIFGSRPAGSASSAPPSSSHQANNNVIPQHQPGPFRQHAQERAANMAEGGTTDWKGPFNPAENVSICRVHGLLNDKLFTGAEGSRSTAGYTECTSKVPERGAEGEGSKSCRDEVSKEGSFEGIYCHFGGKNFGC